MFVTIERTLMKTKKLFFTFFLFSILIFSLPLLAKDMCDSANTRDLNTCFCSDANKADAELNKTYKAILEKYKADAEAIKRIKNAQRAWLQFRDAHIESIYPQEGLSSFGSVITMCLCSAQTNIIQQRVTQLKEILNPIEGDVCVARVTLSDF